MQSYHLDMTHDPGFAVLKLGEKEAKVDIFELNNSLADLQRQHGGDVNAFHNAVSVIIANKLGCEPPSTAMVTAVINWLDEVIEDIRKKLNGLPASPSTSPESTLSGSSAGNVQP